MQQLAVRTKLNGVDVDRMFETINSIKEIPGLADFKFRLNNRWIVGGLNRSTIKNFYGAGQDNLRREAFVVDADEPAVLLGEDTAPNPIEYLLHALVACVTSSLVYHAAAKGIQIHEVESKAEGNIDLRGFLGLDDRVPRGYKDIRVKLRIKADVPPEKLQELSQLGPTYSPVLDTLKRAINVNVVLEK